MSSCALQILYKHTITKEFDSDLGAFTINQNQSNCLLFTVFNEMAAFLIAVSNGLCNGIMRIISLHQTKCQFLQYLQALIFPSLPLVNFLQCFFLLFFLFFFQGCDLVCDSEWFCRMAELKIHAQSYHQLTWFSQIVHTG